MAGRSCPAIGSTAPSGTSPAPPPVGGGAPVAVAAELVRVAGGRAWCQDQADRLLRAARGRLLDPGFELGVVGDLRPPAAGRPDGRPHLLTADRPRLLTDRTC